MDYGTVLLHAGMCALYVRSHHSNGHDALVHMFAGNVYRVRRALEALELLKLQLYCCMDTCTYVPMSGLKNTKVLCLNPQLDPIQKRNDITQVNWQSSNRANGHESLTVKAIVNT